MLKDHLPIATSFLCILLHTLLGQTLYHAIFVIAAALRCVPAHDGWGEGGEGFGLVYLL